MRTETPRPHSLSLGVGTTRLMGVLNVTPDSFFDGSRPQGVDASVAHGLQLVAEGADILDIGGESTRPGHAPVSDAEQLERILPVLRTLRPQVEVPISIDTTRAAVAAAALEEGADWINDTSALLHDPELASVAAQADCPLVLMHRFEPPRDADRDTPGPQVVQQIAAALNQAMERAEAAGVARERILLDPGVGFGTLPEDNLYIHSCLQPLRALGRPLLYGTSRKSFLGTITGKPTEDRLHATAASVACLALQGVEVLRVHDVAAMRDVVRVADAIRASATEGGEPWRP